MNRLINIERGSKCVIDEFMYGNVEAHEHPLDSISQSPVNVTTHIDEVFRMEAHQRFSDNDLRIDLVL